MKKLYLMFAIICCLTLTVGLFAACGNDDKGGGTGGGEGDKVFTETATLEDIIASLENAESLTHTYKCNSVWTDTDTGETCSIETNSIYKKAGNAISETATSVEGNIVVESYTEYRYRSNGTDYDIEIINDEGNTVYANKDLDMIDPNAYSDNANVAVEFLTRMLTADAQGNIIVDTAELGEGYIEDTAYVKLNGSSIEIGWEASYSDEGGSDRESIKYTWSGINATTVEIPADIKALEKEAVWSEFVNYKGVTYQKRTDSDKKEYYAIYGTPSEGAVIEETINTLPVRRY